MHARFTRDCRWGRCALPASDRAVYDAATAWWDSLSAALEKAVELTGWEPSRKVPTYTPRAD